MDSLHMDSQQTFSLLLERLQYASSPNLLRKENPQEDVPAELDVTWREALDKLQIDALYFVGDTPVIYFKRFEAFDREQIADLHRKVWSQSKIPLLFVILPGDIRVYSGYEAPKPAEQGFAQPSRLEQELFPLEQRLATNLWERLKVFTRLAIESGSFWRDYGDKKYFRRSTRADQKLIANLRHIRRRLIKAKLKPEYAHNLIGRSIFALYLQDRNVLTTGEYGYFAQTFGAAYSRYVDLLDSHEKTYQFYEILREHFNGDMFRPTDEEKQAVQQRHLDILRELFTVDATSYRQGLFFWAYNFEFIPIELISAIYEEFLYNTEKGKDGAYYTAPKLVDFMLDNALSLNDKRYQLRILDPACGSGVFLVEAYRRLIERWRKAHEKEPAFQDLIGILKSSIFGVDIKKEALQVAAFSLYLAMMDYIDQKHVWRDVRFPTLLETNLIEADFFDERINFEKQKFDLIIGNPPWESKLTEHAKRYLQRYQYEVGDEQIAQAFLWHAPDFCVSRGQIALLCSSKALLFNRSGSNITFRKAFFRKFAVTKIFDFSALRRILFSNATAPAAAIFYTPALPNTSADIFYGAPKLTRLALLYPSIVIETDDLKQLPVQQVLESIEALTPTHERDEQDSNDADEIIQQTLLSDDADNSEEVKLGFSINLWKVALWGTSYDYILLKTFENYPSLEEVIRARGWHAGAGFIRAADQAKYKTRSYAWLNNAPYLDAKDFTRYGINPEKITLLPENGRYQRGRKPELFKAPLVLFNRGQEQRRPGAAFLNRDCTYSSAMTGIAGTEQDINLLKALTALLNSEVTQYFLFLTSTSWGVEREEITPGDLYTLPFPFLEVSKDQLATIASLVDELSHYLTSSREKELEEKLDKYICACFHLADHDVKIIHETVEYTIKFFHNPTRFFAQQGPSLEMQKSYAHSYANSINFYLEPVGRKLISTVYIDKTEKSPLYAVQFSLHSIDEAVPDMQEAILDDTMREVLFDFHQLDTETLSGRMYYRRNFRIYDNEGNMFYIVKPAEARLWTISASLNDVEETIAELI